MKTTNLVLLAAAISLIFGAIGAFLFLELQSPNQNELIEEFYSIENAVYVSPHSLRKGMASGTSSHVIVDLRSKQEYETEHIISAVNIPAYSDPDTSAYGDVERIVSAFKALKEANPGKNIVVYCYSMPCMTGRKIGKMLADNGIYVKHLGIGWNEWKYYWTLWNHELEWNNTNSSDYIASGPEPGEPKITSPSGVCPINGEFGC